MKKLGMFTLEILVMFLIFASMTPFVVLGFFSEIFIGAFKEGRVGYNKFFLRLLKKHT